MWLNELGERPAQGSIPRCTPNSCGAPYGEGGFNIAITAQHGAGRQCLCTAKALHVAHMAEHHGNGCLTDSWDARHEVGIAFKFRVTSDVVFNLVLYLFEKTKGLSLVTAVDIPITETTAALSDLKFMGLSAATVFPGLDGLCRMMRHAMALKK